MKKKNKIKTRVATNQGIYGINAKSSRIPVTRTGSDISVKVKAIKT